MALVKIGDHYINPAHVAIVAPSSTVAGGSIVVTVSGHRVNVDADDADAVSAMLEGAAAAVEEVATSAPFTPPTPNSGESFEEFAARATTAYSDWRTAVLP